jgi:hypothetical protein
MEGFLFRQTLQMPPSGWMSLEGIWKPIYRMNDQCLWICLCYTALHNNHYTLLLGNTSLYFILQQESKLVTFFTYTCQLSFLHLMHYSIPSFLNVTVLPLQYFHKGCFQWSQQLALSQLRHSIHCSSTIFPYHAFERRPAQETLKGCAGLHNTKNLKALNINPVQIRHGEFLGIR